MNTHTTTPAALAAFGTAALGSSHAGASSSSSGQQAAAPDNPMMPAPMAIAPSEHGIFQGRPPFARSPPPPGSASGSFSFLDGLGAMQAAAEDRSLPPTPRSPSPTCSPPGSPKRQKAAAEREAANRAAAVGGADSAAEDDLAVERVPRPPDDAEELKRKNAELRRRLQEVEDIAESRVLLVLHDHRGR